MSNDNWEYMDDIDYYSDIQKRIPGIRMTTGYRTPEYQEDMKRRGYHPADNSGHLRGEKMDFLPPEGKSMEWLRSEIKRHYPEAIINPNEGDHVDTRFPGYNKAPAVGNAAKLGIRNPNRTPQDDGWEYLDDPTSATPAPASIAAPVGDDPLAAATAGGVPDDLARRLATAQTPEYLAAQRNDAVAGSNLGEVQGGDGNNLQRAWDVLSNNTVDHGIDPFGGKAAVDGLMRTLGAVNELIRGTPLEGAAVALPMGLEALGIHAPAIGKLATAAKTVGGEIKIDPTHGPVIVVKAADGTETIINPASIGKEVDGLTGGSVTDDRLARPDNLDPANTGSEPLNWEPAPTADVIPFPTKEQPPVRNPAEPTFRVPENDNPMGSRVAQQPEDFNPTTTADVAPQANDNFTPVPEVKRVGQDLGNPDNLDGPNGRGNAKSIPNPDELDNMVVRPRTEKAPEVSIAPETPKVADAIVGRTTPLAKAVGNVVKDITSGWKNGPDFHIAQTIDQLPERIKQGLIDDGTEDVPAFFGNDGKVYLIANNLKDASQVKAAVFHEALGHSGLANKFREELDGFLDHLWNTNPTVRGMTSEWLGKNKGTYDGDRVRATEEVLANMSNTGKIPPNVLNRLHAYVRKWARDLGLKLKISNRELLGILEQSQKTVTEGDSRFTGTSGNKYIRSGDAEEARMAGSINLDRLKSRRPIHQMIEDTAESIPTHTQTHEETLAGAKEFKMTKADLEGLNPLKSEEVLASRQYLVTSLNQIDRLSHLIAKGEATTAEHAQFTKMVAEYPAIQAKVSEIASEIGRALESFKITAKGGTGGASYLRYMLNNMDQQALLNVTDTTKLAKQLANAKNSALRKEKILNAFTNAINFPKSIMSSFDLSGPLRQGIVLIGRKEYWGAFVEMFKYLGSEKAYDALNAEIKARPTYKRMVHSRLGLTTLEGKLSAREEAFVSDWAEKLPLVGRGVKASERAYTGFLNKLRADTFDSLIKSYEDAGIPMDANHKEIKEIAKFVNNATGRGSLGKFDHAATSLNNVFFSPRLIASRVAMLNPMTYVNMPPIVRREAIKSVLAFGGIATMITSLFALNGADVEIDPRSSDFAKIKIGNTRYDILGGFGQYITLGARLLTNEKKSAKGEITEMGEKYGSRTGWDTFIDFFTNKEAPVASFLTDMIRKKDAIGQPFEVKEAIAKRVVPMFLQDVYSLMKEEGIAKGAAMSMPGLFGVGMQTYDANKPRPKAPPKTPPKAVPAATENWEYIN